MKKKKKDKVYCAPCKFVSSFYYCEANSKMIEMEFLGPGHQEPNRASFALKNEKNNCPDFKKK